MSELFSSPRGSTPKALSSPPPQAGRSPNGSLRVTRRWTCPWSILPALLPFQTNLSYLHNRAGESLGLHYKMHWPHKQREASRPVRKSPIHDRLAARNACFGEAMGWERPLWFAPEGVDAKNIYSYQRPNWFAYTAEECRAAREGVVVFDQTSFGKHLIQGRNACAFSKGYARATWTFQWVSWCTRTC